MKTIRREITADEFKKLEMPTGQDLIDIFGADIIRGYGLYGYNTSEEDGKFYVEFKRGDSCD